MLNETAPFVEFDFKIPATLSSQQIEVDMIVSDGELETPYTFELNIERKVDLTVFEGVAQEETEEVTATTLDADRFISTTMTEPTELGITIISFSRPVVLPRNAT